MDAIREKINQILDDTKKQISLKNFDKAKKNLEAILILDPEHEEAIYVLTKIRNMETTQKVIEPNVFIEDNLWGLAVVSRYYIDGIEVAVIRDKGTAQITVPTGKHELLIRAKMYGEFINKFEIHNQNSRVRIRTFYKKMGFTFTAEVTVNEQ
jgi:hypothetical protein